MAFVQLEDLQGTIEVVVFPSVYRDTGDLWQQDKVLLLHGRLDAEGGEPKLICESVRDYLTVTRPVREGPVTQSDPGDVPVPKHLHITIRRTGVQEHDIRLVNQVHEMLHRFKGQDRFSLYLADERRRIQLDFPNDTTSSCRTLGRELTALLGQGALRID